MKSINIRGYLMDLEIPGIMGILNVTPDSFFPGSRTSDETAIRQRVSAMVEQGVDIIDIGGCSTRPGFSEPEEDEEWQRVEAGCRIVRLIAPEIPISIDTYRANVARKAIESFKVEIINDVSGGADPEMWPLIAKERVPYVLTHNPVSFQRYNNDLSTQEGHYCDVTAEVITELSFKINELHRLGVNDVIVDPGFGFGKNVAQNFQLLDELQEICEIGLPVLAGISRKSMIYKTLGCTPEEALTGTAALNMVALMKGAAILRVHDVKEAVETVKLYKALKNISLE